MDTVVNFLFFRADQFPFDFVFIIRLRKVDTDTSLAQVIIDQHEELDGEDRGYVEALLSRKTKQKVLLLLDRYDEYTAGTNRALDKVIESGIGNCFTILTSRPGTVAAPGVEFTVLLTRRIASTCPLSISTGSG